MSDLPISFDTEEQLLDVKKGKYRSSAWKYLGECVQQKNCTYLRGLFLELTRLAWLEGTNFMSETRQNIMWTPGNKDLAVELDYSFSGVQKEHPLLIGVKLGDIQYKGIPTITGHNKLSQDEDLEGYTYGKTGEGSVSIVHVGQRNSQVIDMADGTEEFFTVFGPVIASRYGFKALEVVSRTTTTPESKELYGIDRHVSAVNIGFAYEVLWYLKRETPKFMELHFNPVQTPKEQYNINT